MNLTSHNMVINGLPQHSHKPHLFYKFSSKHIPDWCQKNHLHFTIFEQPRTAISKHLESKWLYIPVYLRNKMFVSEV